MVIIFKLWTGVLVDADVEKYSFLAPDSNRQRCLTLSVCSFLPLLGVTLDQT